MQAPEKTVADTSLTPVIVHDKLSEDHPLIVACCHFCGEKGVVVEHFPRRGYGRRNSGPISNQSDVPEEHMENRKPLVCNRIRMIDGSFAWIGHRFLRGGFFTSLNHNELLLYFFLVLAADRQGLSYYHYDKICSLLRLPLDDYIVARNQLIDKDLLAFDGTFFQVLSLPQIPVTEPARLLQNPDDMETFDPATIGQILRKQFNRNHDS